MEKKKWITEDELSEVTVIAESTPGPIAINCATFVGYKVERVLGSIFATLGVVLPSFLIIVFLANLILGYYDNPHLQGAFRWVRALVVGMILAAAVKMGKPCLRNKMQIGLVAVALLLAIVQVHPVILIVGGALASWLLTQPDRESH